MSKFKVGDKVKSNGAQSYANVRKGEEVFVVRLYGTGSVEVGLSKTKGGEVVSAYQYPIKDFDLVAEDGIDWSKPVETKSGEPFTPVTSNGRGSFPVVGYIGDDESVSTFTAEGNFYVGENCDRDLRNAVPKPLQATIVHYENIYKTNDGKGLKLGGITYETRAQADLKATDARVGCIRVERKLVEGQYDE